MVKTTMLWKLDESTERLFFIYLWRLLDNCLKGSIIYRMAENDTTPKLLILGCGYIGTQLAKEAISREWKVTALTRNVEAAVNLTQLGVYVVNENLESDAWYFPVGGDYDYVVNCVSSGKKGFAGYKESYVEGQKSILSWMQSYNYKGKFIYTSSTTVYPQYQEEDVDESADTSDASSYGDVLLESEAIVKEMPADWTVLRLSGIYGPKRTYFIDRVKSGDPISGKIEAYMNLIHRDDVVSAIFACLLSEKSSHQIFNVSDGRPVARVELARWIAQESCLPFPSFLGEVDSTRSHLRTGKHGYTPNRRILADKIKENLGWEPYYSSYSKGMATLL